MVDVLQTGRLHFGGSLSDRDGAKRTIDFLIRVFAAEPLRMIPGSSDKRGGFMDEGGTTWWVSTQIASSRKV